MSYRPALVIAAVLAAMTALAPTDAAVAQDCSDGVWVVVDPGPLGGNVSTRCVPGDPSSGLAALQGAGHKVDYVPGQPGFVCQIDVKPNPCNGAPASAYWSYWHAPQGGSWTYSNSGAGFRSPAPGTVDGWRFGAGSTPPGVAPPGGEPAEEPAPDPEPPAEPPAEESGSDTPPSGSGSNPATREGLPPSSGSSSSESPRPPREQTDSTEDRATPSEAPTPPPTSTDEPDGPDEEPADRSPPIESAELPEEPEHTEAPEELDVAEAPEESDTTTPPQERSDEDDSVALPDPVDGGLPMGVIGGGSLLAGLAGLTAFQLRRRRLED